jgi:hypothetical protein
MTALLASHGSALRERSRAKFKMQPKDVENLPKGNGIAVGSLLGTVALRLIQSILAFCPHIERSRERLPCDPIGRRLEPRGQLTRDHVARQRLRHRFQRQYTSANTPLK